ncbi:MAG: TIGR00730 family Rossman fold protein [Acidobacteriota bacterium]|nr:TIGR00730 family Rossman fold protein [Acidobacteriota bacterium]
MKRICVFTGSSPGARPEYAEAARRFGRALVSRGLELVYGGGSVGLMGVVADTVLNNGGKVHGVIPRMLYDKEVGHDGCTELHIVDTMHDRKAMMADLSDGFVALPGGMGTLEEIFEVLTWAQLGMHRKPAAIYNESGYYDGLIAFLNHAVEERFLREMHKNLAFIGADPDVILDHFADYKPSDTPKWIDRTQT